MRPTDLIWAELGFGYLLLLGGFICWRVKAPKTDLLFIAAAIVFVLSLIHQAFV